MILFGFLKKKQWNFDFVVSKKKGLLIIDPWDLAANSEGFGISRYNPKTTNLHSRNKSQVQCPNYKPFIWTVNGSS